MSPLPSCSPSCIPLRSSPVVALAPLLSLLRPSCEKARRRKVIREGRRGPRRKRIAEESQVCGETDDQQSSTPWVASSINPVCRGWVLRLGNLGVEASGEV